MEDWQQRLIDEQLHLEGKIMQLQSFMYTDKWDQLDALNQGLLKAQCNCMMAYNDILSQRIKLFK